jgi:hypothetical protein
VRASTVDAFSCGFHNRVVEECAYDRLQHKYADVLHLDEVLTHLEGLAAKRKVA